MTPKEGSAQTKFHDLLKRTRALTFSSLYAAGKEMKSKDKVVTVKADLLIIVTAYKDIVSWANASSIYSCWGKQVSKVRNKPVMIDILTRDILLLVRTLDSTSSLVMDSQAHVMALGKPLQCTIIGNLANVSLEWVHHSGQHFSRTISLTSTHRILLTEWCNRSAPKLLGQFGKWLKTDLFHSTSHQTTLPIPKIKLICLLSSLKNSYPMLHIPKQFSYEEGSKKTIQLNHQTHLWTQVSCKADHEEADTRTVLHCMHIDADCVIVSAQDTDVLLLVAHWQNALQQVVFGFFLCTFLCILSEWSFCLYIVKQT